MSDHRLHECQGGICPQKEGTLRESYDSNNKDSTTLPSMTIYKKTSIISTLDPANGNEDPEERVKNEISKIIMPENNKTRGRPKGKVKTAGGLKVLKGPQNFNHMGIMKKKKFLLSWIVPQEHASQAVIKEYDITRKDLETVNVENLSDGFLHPDIDITLIEEHLEDDAWKYLKSLVSQKKKNKSISCNTCKDPLGTDRIICPSCKLGYHIRCVSRRKNETWYCESCFKKTRVSCRY